MDLAITRGAEAAMRAHAASAHPQEACGLLLGQGGVIDTARACANVAPDPARTFEIDPAALIGAHRAARAGGPQVLGCYHSHPSGESVPSATDAAMAAADGRIWAIVAGQSLTFWRAGRQGFSALSLRRIEG